MKKMRENEEKIKAVQRWFKKTVTYKGEAYAIDAEQAAAVVDESQNAIVVARAGSGKTRTIVAKIVYLITQCGVKPEEIMAFVFNANAAAEINARLGEMRVDGVPIAEEVKIASTFHAFARKIVYDACGGKEKCGKILAGEKEEFTLEIVKRMMREKRWQRKIMRFLRGETTEQDGAVGDNEQLKEEELERLAKMMVQFINRAQQKYLGGETTIKEAAKKYLDGRVVDSDTSADVNGAISVREKIFVELGVECCRRYHWYLLNGKLAGFGEYGTDFNLIVSWASKLIVVERGEVPELLQGKRYILIDEYQDFSQLFLAAVEAIRTVASGAKLFVVGDDWQAINRFAGSEVEYFKNFEKYFPENERRYEINTNYRCNYAIVDTARKFMKKAMGEKSEFKAKSRRAGRVMVVETKRTKVQYLETLVKLIRENRKAEEILILHRNNETKLKMSLEGLRGALENKVVRAKIMSAEEYNAKVRMMTMHKAKGLEAEVVIILEADEGVIPNSHPDTYLYGVFGETESVALDDQKRLFYVAMTRAKKRLYIMHETLPQRKMNGFLPYLGRGMEKWEE